MFKVSFEEWLPIYLDIVKKLKIDPAEDRYATNLLSNLLRERGLEPKVLEVKLRGKPTLIFGAGPSLERVLKKEVLESLRPTFSFIAANGATTALMERGFRPDIICTDLDGRVEDQVEANRKGAVAVIHAHGDNVKALLSHINLFEGPIVGSTQVEPQKNVYNFGGFTDGDRSAFLAEWCGASLIAMVGMDLGPKVGKYSKPWLKEDAKVSEVKKLKLFIAKKLLEWLTSKTSTPIAIVEASIQLEGVQTISLTELIEMAN